MSIIIIDLIIVAIISLCIFFGLKRGLTGSLLKIFSFILAVIIAGVLFKPVSNYIIKNTLIDDNIKQAITSIVEEDVDKDGKVKEDSNLPKSIINNINESLENVANDAKKAVIESTAQSITITIVNAGSAIGLFIIVRILLVFVKIFAKFITDLPIIKQIDKLGGFIYGVLEGFIIVFVILSIISFISPLIEQTGLLIAINKSFVGSFLYDNNLLLKMLF